MCGIAGFTGVLPDGHDVIERMTEVITHRGPDDVGFYEDDNMTMGFRRLSIIDLGTGHQPILNEDGTKVLTYNGEIYNYQELRVELIAAGHVFTTQTDSEVLLHGFEEWGPAVLDRLRGMWAFAIYDTTDGSLFLARDRFGIKPLHYVQVGDNLVYASEIKSILEYPGYHKRFNEAELDSYLSFQYVIPPATFFQDVYCLMPGHYLEFKGGQLSITRYWNASFEVDESLTEEEAVRRIDEAFTESVEAHRIADVEVGCFLSSGVDSSWVASYFEGQQTFTVGFDVGDEKYDETIYAEPLAKAIGTTQHSKTISPEEYWEVFPKAQWHFDQPLADPSAIALYFVSKIASEQVKVVLSGEGADELFGGYLAYHEPLDRAKTRQRYPYPVRAAGASLSKLIPSQRHNRFVRSMLGVEDTYVGDGGGHGGRLMDAADKRRILKDASGVRDCAAITRPYYDDYEGNDDIAKMQLFDMNVWMVGDILLKADRMSMANSLELRVPFLDSKVWDVARTLPASMRVSDEGPAGNTKCAMRKAAQLHLPKATAQKPKLGFPTPIRVWLRREPFYLKVREAFLGSTAQRFFDTTALMALLDTHYQVKADTSRPIWTVYSFIIWYDLYFAD